METENAVGLKSSSQKENCWIRQIEVRLYSKLYKIKPMILGSSIIKNDSDFEYDNTGKGNHKINTTYLSDQLSVKVKGVKKISALQDSGSIEISNLTYTTIAQIILSQFYKVEIWIGYRTQSSLKCFFRGEIAYISNELNMRRDSICHIIYASSFVAAYSQKRINFQMNSGINLYAAMRYIFLTAGISDTSLNDSLKNEVLHEISSSWGTPATLAETLANNTRTFSISTDESEDCGIVNFSDLSDKRMIRINENTIIFRKGNPRVTKDGLNISIIPTFNFVVGDIIVIDNSILNVFETTLNEVQTNFSSNYIDTSFAKTAHPNLGAYMIRQIDYSFENRGDTFELNIQARALSIIKNTLGINY